MGFGFTYDSVTSVVTAFVLTIHNTSVGMVAPVVTLGSNHEGTVLRPSEHRMGAKEAEGKWQAINTELCATRKLGFMCERNVNDGQDICLDTEQSICHFEIRSVNQTTLLVYIDQGCVFSSEQHALL